MIAGHFLLAFTVAALTAHYMGKEEAVKIGVLAGLFSVIPDIDIIYAWKEILVLFTSGFYSFTDSFWQASRATHRGLSHSLVTGMIGAAGFTFYRERKNKIFASIFTAFMVFYGLYFGSILSASVMLLFTASGLLIAEKFPGKVSIREFSAAAVFGLLIHPFGDLFTGTPPEFLYPLSSNLMSRRIFLSQDPVFNLLALFSLEIFLGWAALLTLLHIKDRSLFSSLERTSGMGLLFIFSGPFIDAPTMSTAYQFTFSLLILGFTGAEISRRRRTQDLVDLSVNFLSILSLGILSYLIFYLV